MLLSKQKAAGFLSHRENACCSIPMTGWALCVNVISETLTPPCSAGRTQEQACYRKLFLSHAVCRVQYVGCFQPWGCENISGVFSSENLQTGQDKDLPLGSEPDIDRRLNAHCVSLSNITSQNNCIHGLFTRVSEHLCTNTFFIVIGGSLKCFPSTNSSELSKPWAFLVY